MTDFDDPNIRRRLETAKRKMLADSGIPAKDVALISGGLVAETQAVRELRGSPPPLIVLAGAPGVGKTTAASTWLSWLIFDDSAWVVQKQWYGDTTPALHFTKTILFATAAQLTRWKIYDVREMGRLLSATRLVVDDAGAEFAEARLLATLDEVVNVRYAERLATVLTTNLGVEGFRARYGERVCDRLLEAGKFVGLGARSLRGQLRAGESERP